MVSRQGVDWWEAQQDRACTLLPLAVRVVSLGEGHISQEQESKEQSQAAEVRAGVRGEKVSHVHLSHLHTVDFMNVESCSTEKGWRASVCSWCAPHTPSLK